ncbi:MAG: Mov34/MPN/PAD-1 family protein [Candidatus Thermoplasmatota archaeon]|nr:Mov34/MPN/PAD-1 family protein [Candidatus Thermoplasmatota archaeon]
MPSDQVDLQRSEELCMIVRRGDISSIAPVTGPFLDEKKGPLTFLKRERRPDIDPLSLSAASEGLVAMGRYQESIKPLEVLIESGRAGDNVRKVALARAGQIAVLHGLPLDLNPIVSELGLSRKDLGSALRNFRKKRERKDTLVEMESHLLQALLLDDRAEIVESPSLGADHVKAAFEGLKVARSLSMDLEGDIGAYHRARCMYHMGSFMLKRGEMREGDLLSGKALEITVEEGFELLGMGIRKIRGFYQEGMEEAVKELSEARGTAERFGNGMEEMEISFIIGSRLASESEDPAKAQEGITLILHSASMAEELGHPSIGASYIVEAALWCGRRGDPKRGAEMSKTAFRTFKKAGDRDQMIRAGCILFLCYIRSDQRSKAKKLLLELISNHPVKQHPSSFGIMREAVSGVMWLREDRDTRELFEDEVVYTIERAAVDEIIARAKEAHPNEFGAMLRGIPHITHIEPVMEGASARSSFLFSMYSRFSQRYIQGEGVVHSHPSGSARPSRADLSMFGRFPGINIIVGYPYSHDSMAAYDRLGNRVKLEITGPGIRR